MSFKKKKAGYCGGGCDSVQAVAVLRRRHLSLGTCSLPSSIPGPAARAKVQSRTCSLDFWRPNKSQKKNPLRDEAMLRTPQPGKPVPELAHSRQVALSVAPAESKNAHKYKQQCKPCQPSQERHVAGGVLRRSEVPRQ